MSGFFQPRPAALPLSTAHVDLWLVSTALPDATLAHLATLLTPVELERVDRLRIPAKRTEALVSRGILRSILGGLLHQAPASLLFETGPQGKPSLRDLSAPLHFNLSHTAGWILLGVTLGHELGVDMEGVRPRGSLEDLATRYFTETEAMAILRLPAAERPRAFFTVWCRKEAVLKAAGLGISAGLNSFAVPVQALPCSLAIPFADRQWFLHDVPLDDGSLVGSVAIDDRVARLRTWTWLGGEP